VPTIALAAATAITEPTDEKQLFFKTPFNDRLTLEVTAADMKQQAITRVAFLASDDAYGESGLKAFEAAARSNGLTLTGTETFAPTDTDVTAQISRLRGGDPDAYMIWGIPPAAAVVQRNLRQLGITEPAYQGLGVTNATFLKLSGKSAEGVRIAAGKLLVGSSLAADDPLAESIQSFTDRYREAVGSEPNPFAGYAHDAMLIMQSAVDRAVAGSDGELRSRIRNEIERTRELVGVTGVYNFAPDDHVGLDESSVTMIEVEDGKFTPAAD
jgi:branched-chain amino acid transport system substrate-binding protein